MALYGFVITSNYNLETGKRAFNIVKKKVSPISLQIIAVQLALLKVVRKKV